MMQLEVQSIAHSCLFRLSWGQGQQITATVPAPVGVIDRYRDWRKAYLAFYKTSLRARVPKKKQKKIQIPQNWQRQLVEAEASLLQEFRRWLRHESLYELRAKINSFDRLYVTCEGDLERLPWESWELDNVAILRSPKNIRGSSTPPITRRRKPRILAILGDDTGLDLKSDRASITALNSLADISVVTWQHSQTPEVIKAQIQQALEDDKGWEMLFFAGHSDETALTGGEIAIAPGISLAVSEIAPQLTTAKNNGLRFALFNSCSGSAIAKSLIDLGLSQVGVMREPIHNRVAQEFLVQFLTNIGNHQNVYQALQTACGCLQEKKLTYPSAYLIPSLYGRSDAELFAIEPYGWQAQIRRWLPTKKEAIAIAAIGMLSILPPVESWLLDKRTLIQSLYRDVTEQISDGEAPITLVHIDPESLTKAGITDPVPMDRSYLASIINQLEANSIVGIDYLFDFPQPEHDATLAQAVKTAAANRNWFVFSAYLQTDGKEIGVNPETNIGNPNWTMQGFTDSLPQYVNLLPQGENCDRVCPFPYLIAMLHDLDVQPSLENTTPIRPQVYQASKNAFFQNKFSTLTLVSQYLGQQWLRPIQDFSLPPDRIYQRLPAWKLLEQPANLREVIIIGSGGYSEAGLTPGSDNFKVPAAVAYWRTRRGLDRSEDPFTGSEILSYSTHHWLARHLVIPIPTLWIVAIAFLLAKGSKLSLEKRPLSPKWLLIALGSATTAYSLFALQLYVAGLLLPWLLPSLALWSYLLPVYLKK